MLKYFLLSMFIFCPTVFANTAIYFSGDLTSERFIKFQGEIRNGIDSEIFAKFVEIDFECVKQQHCIDDIISAENASYFAHISIKEMPEGGAEIRTTVHKLSEIIFRDLIVTQKDEIAGEIGKNIARRIVAEVKDVKCKPTIMPDKKTNYLPMIGGTSIGLGVMLGVGAVATYFVANSNYQQLSTDFLKRTVAENRSLEDSIGKYQGLTIGLGIGSLTATAVGSSILFVGLVKE